MPDYRAAAEGRYTRAAGAIETIGQPYDPVAEALMSIAASLIYITKERTHK